MPDWYPNRLTDLPPWHTNFSAQATLTGTAHGLVAAQVTQIGLDSTNVTNLVNMDETVRNYNEAWTQFRDILLRGELNAPLPPVPGPPAAYVIQIGSATAIEARTRQYAAIVKASPGYTQEIGELYGIVPAAPVAPTVPQLTASALTQSQVSIRVLKGGYAAVALDSRRGGGAWEQIAVVLTATYTDGRPPLVVGQPEQREYRGQGMVGNDRSGPLSAVVSAVTVP